MPPSFENRNGDLEGIEGLLISETTTLTQPYARTIVVTGGATLTSLGALSGTVDVKDGALDAQGPVSGTVRVRSGARAHFATSAHGTLTVDHGGIARIGPNAQALGTMRIDGVLENEGQRGVQVSGAGRIEDLPGSRVRQPDASADDGGIIYRG